MPKVVRVSTEKIRRVHLFCLQNNIPFRMHTTNQRIELYSDIGNYTNRESEFPASELNFIKRVKDTVIKLELYKKVPNHFKTKESRDKIIYFYYNPSRKSGDLIKNCFEIDLTSAYWETARNLGLLPDNIYEKGNTVSKPSRLACIGTFAKTINHYTFDGKKQKRLDPEYSETTEYLWHTISYKIGKLMRRASRECGKDFIFFWVDAMFIHKTAVPKLKILFKEAGFQFKIEKCKFIRFDEKNITVKGKGKYRMVNREKVFSDERVFPYNKQLNDEKKPE